MIDGDKIREIVKNEFNLAGFSPADTDTGAVIITGESARKENAALVLEKLSDFAGDFVVSTAGPDLESIIAGKGSGAWQYSIENACTVANLDIGGGTTNIVLFDNGDVIAKGCLDIGGRQIKVDQDYVVRYVSDSAKKIADSLNIDIAADIKITKQNLSNICDSMADLLGQALGIFPKTPLFDAVVTSGSTQMKVSKPIKAISFSGGVADCIYKTVYDDIPYGDIGVFLGRSIKNSALFSNFRNIIPSETIRATVVGAGTYTTSVSGSTITYTNRVFPLKNVPVLFLDGRDEQRCFQGDVAFLLEKIKWFLTQNSVSKCVLAFRGASNPSYKSLITLAECLTKSLDASLKSDEPILIVVESDMAKALGQIIKRLIGDKRSIVVLDKIKVSNNDYIDFGKPLMDGFVIPVVVKTLIFG
ncbi:hypothetical protein SDC9_124531 [bioreactor metagenome]|uniref:Reactivating factor for ethanolamine ammonia lyase n=1 Tax=bioreactor metagenome TaxID=1076179 RepID=A0A645CKQ7_9ZZZZ